MHASEFADERAPLYLISSELTSVLARQRISTRKASKSQSSESRSAVHPAHTVLRPQLQREATPNLEGTAQRHASPLSPVDSSLSYIGPGTTTPTGGYGPEVQNLPEGVTQSRRSADPSSAVSDAAYLGETRVLSIVAQDLRQPSTTSLNPSRSEVKRNDLPGPELQESFIETYFEYCWPWCRVLDQETLRRSKESSPSPLLVNALALLGCRIRPPIVEHAGAAEYYHQAKTLFYNDQESNPLLCLQSIVLFYWWAPRSPDIVHKDAAWWWTGLAIKFAQQLGLHREPKDVRHVGGDEPQGLRRRIWWTLFARERLTALCQGRPCTINPDDCTVREPCLEDFGPLADPRAQVFIHWVRLCDIIGKVGQHLSRSSGNTFPVGLAWELIGWIRNLPLTLNLPITSERTRTFDRNVHKLHLPYLATVALLHMKPSSQHSTQNLPQVYTTAISAASCIARIFKDLLARGHIRFLGAIATWYASVAIIALLPTQRIDRLAKHGREEVGTLKAALVHMSSLWPTATIFLRGFERLKAFENMDGQELHSPGSSNIEKQRAQQYGPVGLVSYDASTSTPLPDENWMHGISWHSYFPFASEKTSDLLSEIFGQENDMLLGCTFWDDDAAVMLQDLFESADYTFLDPLLSETTLSL